MRDCRTLSRAMPNRPRTAIAYFAERNAAAAMLADIAALGVDAGPPTALAEDEGACALRIALPAALERRLLALLLSSEATRVEVHDTLD